MCCADTPEIEEVLSKLDRIERKRLQQQTHTHTKRINTHTHAQFDLRVDFMRYINFELNSALLLVVRLECIVLVETTSQHLV